MKSAAMEGVEEVVLAGQLHALVIRRNATARQTTFFSPAECSLQFGLLAHPAGYVEPTHVHKEIERVVRDIQQMFVVQHGMVAVDFYDGDGEFFREIVLTPGDAILLIAGAHRLRVLEEAQCLTVKQGPFLGDHNDKVVMQART